MLCCQIYTIAVCQKTPHFPITVPELETFQAAVAAITAEGTTEAAREEAKTYLTSFSTLQVAALAAERETNPTVLFYAGMSIESIVENCYEDVAVTSEMPDLLVRTIVRRLNSRLTTLTGFCADKFISCLAVIAAHFIDYIDKWPEYGPAVTLPFFARLFEYRHKKRYDEQDELSRRLTLLAQTSALGILRETRDMTKEWIVVAVEVLKSQENDNFVVLYEFIDRMRTIPEQPALFPDFFELFNTLVNDFGDGDEMCSGDKEFIEQIMEIMFAIAEQLHEDQMKMAMLIYKECFDFSSDFFIEQGRRPFALKALGAFVRRVPELAEDPEEFFELMRTVSEFIANIVSRASGDIWQILLAFADAMTNLVTANYEVMGNNQMAEIFASLVGAGQEFLPEPMMQFYGKKLENPESGVIFAISSSVTPYMSAFVPRLCELLLTQDAPVPVALYFVKKQCGNAGENLGRMIEYLYSAMQRSFDPFTAKCLVSVTRHCAGLFLSKPDELLTPVVQICESVGPDGFAYLVKALLNVMIEANPEVAKQLADVIGKNLTRIICGFITEQNVAGLFEFLPHVVKCRYERFRDFYALLFDQICSAMEPLWSMQNELVARCLCEFLELCVTSKIVKNPTNIIDWVSNTLSAVPIPELFSLLTAIAANSDFYVLFNEQPVIMKFIVQAKENGQLPVECVRLVVTLVQRQWKGFFFYFNPDFVFSLIRSDDVNIVEQGLLLLFCIKFADEVRPCLEALVHVIIEGMFTSFVESCVRTAITILLSIVQEGICPPEEMAKLILANIPPENRYARPFATMLVEGRDIQRLPLCAQRMIESLKRQQREHP